MIYGRHPAAFRTETGADGSDFTASSALTLFAT